MKGISDFYKNERQVWGAERGFSILELIVSMVVFLIVTGAVFGVMQVARQSRSIVTENTSLNKNIRLALNIIGRDAYNAGFGYPLGNTVILPDDSISSLINVPNDVDPAIDRVPPIIAGNDRNLDTYNTTPNTFTDQITFLFKDSTFNVLGAVGPPDTRVSQPLNINAPMTTGGGIDEIVPISGSNASCRVNDIYLITGNTASTLGLSTALVGADTVQFSSGDVLGFNQPGPGGPIRSITLPASMQRVNMVTYFVTADGTLTRREFANVPAAVPAVAFVDEPLVYGVENFQIIYIMDDGTLSNNPSAGADGIPGNGDDVQNNLAAIRQIRFTVNIRSLELNAARQPYRTSMTSTFSTRNLGYDAN